LQRDRFAAIKADYERTGPGRSNQRFGFIRKSSEAR
jgi:hypothetical protein